MIFFLHQILKRLKLNVKEPNSLLIEVGIPSQENEWSCICLLGISILLISTILLLDLGTVPAN